MATMMYPTLTKSQSMRSKRKSAVELLAESKPFYVKSEIVRDTTQALPSRPNSNFGSYGTYNRSKSVNVTGQGINYRPTTLPQYMAVSPSRSLPPLTHRRSVHSGNSDMLQNKLRQLLVCDSAEELCVEQMAPLSPPAEYAQRCHKSLPDLHCRGEPSSNKSSNKSLSNRDSGGSSGHYTQRSEPAPPPRQVYPPPTTFKRQKCLRYKRDRPILRSKSDISDRYWRPPEPPTSHLQQFFEHLGLTSDSYEEMLSNSGSSKSPIFFSDVSTVDSSRPIDNADYYPSTYRSSEPPSIVERNARIIKWLCNCRKLQLT
ncbi:protein FAM110C isoform X2 [Anoplophora glabripennis]|uniref:protein FAM110C isoform X2 n=1 Tax=Anoplophora glabripennis TaxID=217634 RepID=UPI000874410E|nr:protein FAM110C isoform X2 [Anoplophora glabripennis]